MRINFAALRLVLILGFHFTMGSSSEPISALQHRDLESRVIGGTIANSARFPYYTFIKSYSQYGDGGSCGGSLIAPDMVLTAAHCLGSDGFSTSSILGIDVFVNSTTYKYSEYEYYREATKWVVHPDFDYSRRVNDIALIFLDAPVKGVPLVVMNRNASIPVSIHPSFQKSICSESHRPWRGKH